MRFQVYCLLLRILIGQKPENLKSIKSYMFYYPRGHSASSDSSEIDNAESERMLGIIVFYMLAAFMPT